MWTALPNGSKIDATSRLIVGSCNQTLVIGRAMYSANAPGRLTPIPLVSLHRCRRPARQLRQRPQTTCPSPLTMSPGRKSATFEPTATISPTNSWPTTIGTGIVFWAQASQLIDVHVGPANAGAPDLDQHVVDADLRFGDIFQPQSDALFPFHQRLHNPFCSWRKRSGRTTWQPPPGPLSNGSSCPYRYATASPAERQAGQVPAAGTGRGEQPFACAPRARIRGQQGVR